jgi:anti-sigma-K factor RskA
LRYEGNAVSEHLEEHLDLCAGYALGSLDAPDRIRLEAHLADGCPACEAALVEFDAAVTLLAATAPAVPPPAALRERVLRGVRDEAPRPAATVTAIDAAASQPKAPRGTRWGWIAAAACLALSVWGWAQVARLRVALQTQEMRVAQLERDRSDLEERLAAEQRWVGIVTSAKSRRAEFAATPAGDPALHGRAFVDPDSRRAVIAFSNLHARAGHDYELWAIRDGKPHSLGLVHPDANGAAQLQLVLDDAPTVQALAVSVEPAGGAPTRDAPTGPVVLVGPLEG